MFSDDRQSTTVSRLLFLSTTARTTTTRLLPSSSLCTSSSSSLPGRRASVAKSFVYPLRSRSLNNRGWYSLFSNNIYERPLLYFKLSWNTTKKWLYFTGKEIGSGDLLKRILAVVAAAAAAYTGAPLIIIIIIILPFFFFFPYLKATTATTILPGICIIVLFLLLLLIRNECGGLNENQQPAIISSTSPALTPNIAWTFQLFLYSLLKKSHFICVNLFLKLWFKKKNIYIFYFEREEKNERCVRTTNTAFWLST